MKIKIIFFVFLSVVVEIDFSKAIEKSNNGLFEFGQPDNPLGIGLNTESMEMEVFINQKVWLKQNEISRIFATMDETVYSYSEGSLELANTSSLEGRDIIGKYTGLILDWEPEDLKFKTSLRLYNEKPIVVFKQEFHNTEDDLIGTNIGTTQASYEMVSTSFPSLTPVVSKDDRKGFMSFGGNMAGWTAFTVAQIVDTNSKWEVPLRGGELGGPVALFNDEGSEVLVISSLTQFMSSNMEVRWARDEDKNVSRPVMDFGLMGSIQSIPSPGLELEFVLVFGSSFSEAFETWGETLMAYHGKIESPEIITSTHLGYWTDNGAYYYYHTLGENVTYEDTFLQLDDYFERESLPFNYIEIDSWWYYKGELQGVTNWTELPDIFPNGLNYIQTKTGWPIAAHNRYWSKDNVYAEQNGGDFKFYIEENGALPKDENFWNYLFNEASKWGLKVYEQDWLDVQYRLARITHTDLKAARNWLLEMGRGATLNGIDLIYCMALPREILQSVEIEAVKTARVSGDYILSLDQWRVGLSSYLSVSLGLTPFKDVFWTKHENPGNPFYYDCMIVSNNTDPNIPWTLNYRYNGYKNVTKSGKPCLTWYDLDLHWLAPNGDLERDACRTLLGSPWGEGAPFCFVAADPSQDQSQWIWEECSIPVCGVDCIRDGVDPPNPIMPLCGQVREEKPDLQSVVSVLTRGGVGIGDKIENVDSDLTMRTCRKDGHIIRPDKPALATPIQILTMAFSGLHSPTRPHSEPSIGEIWHTQTILQKVWDFKILFIAETNNFGLVQWNHLFIPEKEVTATDKYILYFSDGDGIKEETVQLVSHLQPIEIPNLGILQYLLLHLSPVWTLGNKEVSLIGETGKIVHVSNDRIIGIDIQQSIISLKIKGSLDEDVQMSWAVHHQEGLEIFESSCVIAESGLATIIVDFSNLSSTCIPS